MKRNKLFFYILPTIQINPTTGYYVISFLKWSIAIAMKDTKFNNIVLKLTKL